jgi:mono/diheme cytochrome c family protein
MPDGELFWKVTVGIGNTAMPQWGMLLAEEDRWNAIYYVKRTFISPSEPEDVSDELPVQYQALESPYENTADAKASGKQLYETLCAGCHGVKALGDGPYGAPLMPTPANLTEDPAVNSPAEWWYWRVDQGVVGFDGGDEKNLHPTAMPAWRFILNDQQKWDIVYYARDLVGAKDPGANQ